VQVVVSIALVSCVTEFHHAVLGVKNSNILYGHLVLREGTRLVLCREATLDKKAKKKIMRFTEQRTFTEPSVSTIESDLACNLASRYR
jgi:hypothetical protein